MQANSNVARKPTAAAGSLKSFALPPWGAVIVKSMLWLGNGLCRGVAAIAAVFASLYARCWGQAPTETPEAVLAASAQAAQALRSEKLLRHGEAHAGVGSGSRPVGTRRGNAALYGDRGTPELLARPHVRSRRASLSALTAPLSPASSEAHAPLFSDEERLAALRQCLARANDDVQSKQAQLSHIFMQLAASQVNLSRAERHMEAMSRRVGGLQEQLANTSAAWLDEAALRDRAEQDLKALRRNVKKIHREAEAEVAEALARLEDAEARAAEAEARADRASGPAAFAASSPVLSDLADRLARLSLRSPTVSKAAADVQASGVFIGQGDHATPARGLLFARPKAPRQRAGTRAPGANKSAS